MVKLKLKAFKAGFFDRDRVIGAVDKATRRVLSKFGAFVRTRARTSIRKRKGGTSEPGKPPFSHLGLLRDFIFFAYDGDRRSVVIGPALINRASGAPENLEYGGEIEGGGRVIYITNAIGRDEKGQFVSNGRTAVKLEGKIKIRPRPYMKPALDAELPGLPAMWRDSVR